MYAGDYNGTVVFLYEYVGTPCVWPMLLTEDKYSSVKVAL